jgi:hypothetical protein
VPKGKFQIDADTWLSNTAAGARTDQLLFTNPTFKYGLTDSSQLNWVPFTRVWRRDANGDVSSVSGVGDATVRFKQSLTLSRVTFSLPFFHSQSCPPREPTSATARLKAAVPSRLTTACRAAGPSRRARSWMWWPISMAGDGTLA